MAIFAIALHTILTGLAPLAAAAPVDPFSVICHSQPADAAPNDQTDPAPSRTSGPCDHCKLCSAIPAPLAPQTLLDTDLRPAGLADVLYPTSLAPAGGIALTPKLAQGPPQRA